MLDRVAEKCGVFGIYAPGEEVARIAFFGLFALQHRGQESAGIAVSDGREIRMHKAMGLVGQVFNEENLSPLKGFLAVGHNRYSTTGASASVNAQPIRAECELGPFALAHNGNLVNCDRLRERLEERGKYLVAITSDTQLIAFMIAEAKGSSWEEKIERALPELAGAYSLVIGTPDKLIGIQDPLGVRPLCLGSFNGGWVIASESCALATIGASFLREIEPGETVVIDEGGIRSFKREAKELAFCLFEYVYLARPDSLLKGRYIYSVRQEIGRQLAREYPVEADFVMPIPDTAITAAIGYAEEAELPFVEGVIKNRYIQRTFIQPSQRLRDLGVRLKLNPLPEVLGGKRVVVVDDSIVRGTTTGPTVGLLKEAGAKEIHLRICCPPYAHPCYLGINVATYEELIAHHMTIEEIRGHVGADTLGYLSLDRLIAASGRPRSELCTGCFTGRYPRAIIEAADESIKEKICGPARELCRVRSGGEVSR